MEPGAPAIDPEAFALFSADMGDDAEIIRQLVDVFLEETPRLLDDLAAALRVSDANRARRLAHSLKSSAATLGAARLSRLARDVEMATTVDIAQSAAIVEHTRAEFERVRTALRAA